MRKHEIRTNDCQLALREAGPGEAGDARTITGRAIVFGRESEILDDLGERFREVILPEAVTAGWLATQDVKMNLLHDRGLTLARCNHGEGTLRLAVDAEGVTFEFEAPRCDIGDRCLEMVRRGDYSGCSFEFVPEEWDVEERGGGKDVIVRHRRFRLLSALTIGMDPAYRQTSVSARELRGETPAAPVPARESPAALNRRRLAAMEREVEIEEITNPINTLS